MPIVSEGLGKIGMHWGDTVRNKVQSVGPLILGIDPAPNHAPAALGADPDLFLQRYTEALLDGAGDKVAFVKFQSAYFEAFGSAGIRSLAKCIASARERGLGIILDAKRGDISSTADAYAQAYLVPGASDLEVDCMTINPFLGPDTLEPFLKCARSFGKGLFVLVKTSNEGSGWLQDKKIDGASVSHRIADLVAKWADETVGDSGVAAVGAVVGATYPAEAEQLRRMMPKSVFLAPGLGAQGGDPEAMSKIATRTGPVLISASRGIAAVDDVRIGIEEYISLIGRRVDAFRRQVAIAA
jgi:orotidine-5'-phosphate decarboxylase